MLGAPGGTPLAASEGEEHGVVTVHPPGGLDKISESRVHGLSGRIPGAEPMLTIKSSAGTRTSTRRANRRTTHHVPGESGRGEKGARHGICAHGSTVSRRSKPSVIARIGSGCHWNPCAVRRLVPATKHPGRKRRRRRMLPLGKSQ